MAKERSEQEKKERKEKKEKKEKRSEKEGVHKSKKEKKEKKSAEEGHVATPLLNKLAEEEPEDSIMKDDEDSKEKVKVAVPLGALVPFANPLADEKVGKKVLRSVKKGMKCSTNSSFWLGTDVLLFSCKEQVSKAGRQRSGQISSKIYTSSRRRGTGRCHPRCRYFANGCHITYSSTV